MKEYVAGLLFTQNVLLQPMVALVHKKRPAWQAGRWNGIGGHIEWGETPVEAMRREFEEETSAKVSWWQHFATLEDPRWGEKDTAAWRVYWFCAIMHDSMADEVKTAGDEEIRWHPLSQLPDTIPNLRWLIPLAQPDQAQDWPFRVVEKDLTALLQGSPSVAESSHPGERQP